MTNTPNYDKLLIRIPAESITPRNKGSVYRRINWSNHLSLSILTFIMALKKYVEICLS